MSAEGLHAQSDALLLLFDLGVLGSLILAVEIGFRLGKRFRGRGDNDVPGMGTVHGAIIGLLALMLAFTYSSVSARTDARKQAVTAEAGVLARAYFQAGLAPEPQREAIRGALRDYTEARVVPDEVATNPSKLRQALMASSRQQQRLRRILEAHGRQDDRTGLSPALVQAIIDVLDMHIQRIAAARDRLPWVILGLLLLIALLATGLTGFAAGTSGHRHVFFTGALVISVAAVIAVIADLGTSRSGLIRVSQDSLRDVLQIMREEPGDGAAGNRHSADAGDSAGRASLRRPARARGAPPAACPCRWA